MIPDRPIAVLTVCRPASQRISSSALVLERTTAALEGLKQT